MKRDESITEVHFTYDDLAGHLRAELGYNPSDEQLYAFADIVRRQLREDITKRGNLTIQTIVEDKIETIKAIKDPKA